MNVLRGNALSMDIDGLTPAERYAPAGVVLAETRRLLSREPAPKLGDDPQPWRHHGWLLAMGILGQAGLIHMIGFDRHLKEQGGSILSSLDPAIKRRYPHMVDALRRGGINAPTGWSYMQCVLLNNRLPEEPLPEVLWDQQNDQKTAGYLHSLLRLIDGRHGGWGKLRILMEWMGYGLAVHDRYPPELSDEDAEQLYRTLDLAFFWLNPCDMWGALMSENIGSGWNPNAFFPTPLAVTKMMATMVMHDGGEETRHLTVMDPCVGTGRMLLSAGNRSMRLYGIDVDPLMVLATKINLAVHLPWGVVTFNDSWWNREVDRLGLDASGKTESAEPPAQTTIPVRAARPEEVEELSATAGYDIAAVAAARTATIGGESIQLYLPGFWKEVG